jgi:hypothetical protein
MREAPSKPFKGMFFCELWALFSSPINDAMLLENLLDCSTLATQLTSVNDLLVCILWV